MALRFAILRSVRLDAGKSNVRNGEIEHAVRLARLDRDGPHLRADGLGERGVVLVAHVGRVDVGRPEIKDCLVVEPDGLARAGEEGGLGAGSEVEEEEARLGAPGAFRCVKLELVEGHDRVTAGGVRLGGTGARELYELAGREGRHLIEEKGGLFFRSTVIMVPNEELPVLETLVSIRNRLTALKKDRTEYIRARDVLDIYSALMNEGACSAPRPAPLTVQSRA